MPDLPTITVTAAQAQKLVEAFGDQASYLEWLREALRNEVRRRIVVARYVQLEAQVTAEADAAADAVLPQDTP